MKMQDNELDDLFRTRLDGFETEPSARVWQGIDAGLGTDRRKKIVLLQLLSTAASIIVLITAGILFITHKNEFASHKPAKESVAVNKRPDTAQIVAQAAAVTNTPRYKTISGLIKQAAIAQATKLNPPAIQQKDSTTVNPQTTTHTATETLAQVPQKHTVAVAVATVDTNATLATPATLTANPAGLAPTAIAANTSPAEKPTSAQPKKRGIHSLGDMLNVVIAKVDKRKDKILEFSDTDDDESTITGVNLGIIAVKKQN